MELSSNEAFTPTSPPLFSSGSKTKSLNTRSSPGLAEQVPPRPGEMQGAPFNSGGDRLLRMALLEKPPDLKPSL